MEKRLMTNKNMFIQEVEELIKAEQDIFSEGARAYFEQLKAAPEKEKAPFTSNGAKVLRWMQEHYEDYNNIMKAKEIGEGLFCSSRTVSGCVRKLITDGYVVKIEGNPVCYSLTDNGKTCIIPEKEESV